MKIEFSKDMQPSNRAEIEHYLNKVLWLVPGWVHVLRVNLYSSGDEPGELACIRVMYDYREATIDFACGWLDEPDDNKLKTLLHEILHIHINLIADYARAKFDIVCDSENEVKFNKSLKAELTIRTESATHDLAKVITDRLLRPVV